jgi:hypothetical protein
MSKREGEVVFTPGRKRGDGAGTGDEDLAVGGSISAGAEKSVWLTGGTVDVLGVYEAGVDGKGDDEEFR